jgi:hypothetical protein
MDPQEVQKIRQKSKISMASLNNETEVNEVP